MIDGSIWSLLKNKQSFLKEGVLKNVAHNKTHKDWSYIWIGGQGLNSARETYLWGSCVPPPPDAGLPPDGTAGRGRRRWVDWGVGVNRPEGIFPWYMCIYIYVRMYALLRLGGTWEVCSLFATLYRIPTVNIYIYTHLSLSLPIHMYIYIYINKHNVSVSLYIHIYVYIHICMIMCIHACIINIYTYVEYIMHDWWLDMITAEKQAVIFERGRIQKTSLIIKHTKAGLIYE